MKKYKYGICTTTYNRPNYLSKFLETLKNTNFLEGTVIRILDDESKDSGTLDLLKNFQIDNPNVQLHVDYNIYNIGPVHNYTKNVIKFIDDEVDFIVNLDSDCIVNSRWLQKLNDVNNHFGPDVVSSVFWCDHGYPTKKFVINEEVYLKTRSLNGACLCFPKYFINDFVNKNNNRSFDGFTSTDLRLKYGLDTVTTELSYVEHIGLQGINWPPDAAKKFVGL